MKKYLPIFKVLSLVLVIILTATSVNAQRVATVSGNWNVAATWGGAAPPTALETATINDGVNVTVTANAACASLTINGGLTPTTFTINNAVTLNVTTSMGGSGAVLINAGTDAASARLLTLTGTGVLTAVSLTMADVLPGNSASTLTINTGSATFSTDITMNGAGAENAINVASGGDLFIGGTVSQTNGTLSAVAGSNVEYNGAAQTVRPATYALLTLSGSAVKTMPAAGLAITNLTMAGSAAATTAGAIVIPGAVILNNSSSLTTGATFTVTGAVTLNNTSSLTTGSTTTFNSTLGINAGTNLTIGGFDFTANGVTTVAGTLTSNSTAGTKTFNANLNVSIGGNFNSTADENYTLDDNLDVDGAFTSGNGIYTFTGGGTPALTGTATITNAVFANSYQNLGIFTFTSLSVNVGETFTNNGTTTVITTLGGAGSFTQGTGDFLNYSGIAAPAITTFTATAAGNTVNYNLVVGQTVRATTYSNLSLTGSGVKDITGLTSVTGDFVMSGASTTATTAAALTIGGTLTMGASTVLSVEGFNFAVNGTGGSSIAGTININSLTGTKTFDNLVIAIGGVFNSAVNEDYAMTGSLANNGTINAGTGLWTFSGTGIPAISGVATIPNATFIADYTNSGDFTFTNLTITGGGVTLTNNGTVTATTTLAGTGEFLNNASDILNFGGATIGVTTFTATAADNIVNYNGAGAQTVRASEVYEFVTLSGSGAKTLAVTVTIGETLSIQGTATTAGAAPTYAATATLEYKGSGVQTTGIEFPGTGATPTNLRIDNAAGVTLAAAKNINGALSLQTGFLTTTLANLLTINAAGTATTAGSAYVNGPLAKVKNTVALFTFPVGNTTGGLRTIGVTPSAVTATTYRAEFFSVNPRTVPNGTNLGTLSQISACEYWDLTQTAGTTSARVTVSWPGSGSTCGTGTYVTDIASLVVGHHNGTNWTNQGQVSFTGTAGGGGTITSTNFVPIFSPFVLATTNAALNPLPVKFVDVKAYEKGTGVQIDWSNLTESELVKYVVERSADGQNFTSIGEQSPRSNLAGRESYSKFDASPLAVNFYRITAIEFSGKTIYSKILRVDMGSDTKSISVYPNPTRDNQVSLGINTRKGVYTMRIFNNAGQEVMAKQLNHPGGALTQTVELPASVKAGVYNLLISGDNYRQSKTFIVQ